LLLNVEAEGVVVAVVVVVAALNSTLVVVLVKVLALMEVARVVDVVGQLEDAVSGGWLELGVDSSTPLGVLAELQLLEGWVT
jgi:hypothetical protein